jgi:hypothetical protein
MENKHVKAIIDAMKAADIKVYEFLTDNVDHFYNNADNSIVLYDDSDDPGLLVNIKSRYPQTIDVFDNNKGNLLINVAACTDIHAFKTGCDFAKAKAFVESLGLTLTEDQQKILIKTNASNRNIKPETGDYLFRVLSDEEIAKLSPEEKEAYEKAFKEHNKLADHIAIQVTV